MTTELGLTYAGISSLDMPVVINAINRPFSMNSSEIVQEVTGKNGNVWMGNNNSSISFSIDITILGDTRQERINNTRIAANWLFQIDNYQEYEMIFDEEPDKSYYGHFTGAPTIAELSDWGTTTLTFTCSDPFAYKEQVNTDAFTSSPVTLSVNSQVPTKPIINVEVNSDITSLALTNSNNDYIFLGSPVDLDQGQTQANKTPLVFMDPMTDSSSWATNTDENYINGTVAGQFEVSAQAFLTTSSDYGTGTSWHGPSLKKFIPGSQQLQDFRMNAVVWFDSLDYKSMGVCRIYLLDANNNSIGYICLKDNDNVNPFAVFQAKAGTESNGHDICYTGQQHWELKKNETLKKKVRGRWVWYTQPVNIAETNIFNNFYGILSLQRIGNTWTASITKWDSNNMPQWTYSYKWMDSNNQYTGKLSGVAIYNAAYGTAPVMTHNQQAEVRIYQILDGGVPGATEVPVIASAGDEIMIDCESFNILKNGE